MRFRCGELRRFAGASRSFESRREAHTARLRKAPVEEWGKNGARKGTAVIPHRGRGGVRGGLGNLPLRDFPDLVLLARPFASRHSDVSHSPRIGVSHTPTGPPTQWLDW